MRLRHLSTFILCLLAAVPAASALTTWKGTTSGYWDIPTNWAGGFPISNSTVRLNHERQTNSYTVVIQTPAITDKLWIDTYAEIPIHVLVNHTGSLQLNSMRMGFKEDDRESTFTIDGGRVWGLDPINPDIVTNTAFLVGNNPECSATMNILNNGSLSVMGSNGLIVASSKESSGLLKITDGALLIRDSLILGKGPGATGEMNISGSSSISITGALHIAKLDNGAIMPTGTVYMAGGLLECDSLNIGAHGTGFMTLNNGNVRVLDGGITVGLSNADGTLTINDGTLQASNSFLNIGHTDSSGLVTLNNGTVDIDGTTSIGSSSRGQGQLDLVGGSLSTDQLLVGPAVSATGALNLYGGELCILGTENDAFQISNSCVNLQQSLFHWENIHVTEWITNAVLNSTLCWSNGFANGTFSTNGFDGSFTNENGILYWDNSENGSQFSQSTIWTEQHGPSPFDIWIDSYQLSESNALWSADPDHDQLDNLTEFGLGGNPTNAVEEISLPMLSPNSMEYVYRQRSDPETFGLLYYPEQCSDLIIADWTTNGFTTFDASQESDGFIFMTNEISSDSFTNRFIRLRIELR